MTAAKPDDLKDDPLQAFTPPELLQHLPLTQRIRDDGRALDGWTGPDGEDAGFTRTPELAAYIEFCTYAYPVACLSLKNLLRAVTLIPPESLVALLGAQKASVLVCAAEKAHELIVLAEEARGA